LTIEREIVLRSVVPIQRPRPQGALAEGIYAGWAKRAKVERYLSSVIQESVSHAKGPPDCGGMASINLKMRELEHGGCWRPPLTGSEVLAVLEGLPLPRRAFMFSGCYAAVVGSFWARRLLSGRVWTSRLFPWAR